MLDVIRQHIEIVDGAGGPKPRIGGRRIRVQDLAIWHVKLGMSPDEIIEQYPTLTLADVYAALAYYWDHREEKEQIIADEKAFVEELRRNESSLLQEKLGPELPPP